MKKTINFLALVMLMIAVAIPVGAKSPKATETAVFTVVPQMTCQNCENKIKSNLRFENGVSNIATSLADQTVTVTFDPAKTNSEQLIAAFQKIGYTATWGKAAAAPAGKCGDCKGHDGACTKPIDQQCADCKAKTQAANQQPASCPKAAAGTCSKASQGNCSKSQQGCSKGAAGTCPKAAKASCAQDSTAKTAHCGACKH